YRRNARTMVCAAAQCPLGCSDVAPWAEPDGVFSALQSMRPDASYEGGTQALRPCSAIDEVDIGRAVRFEIDGAEVVALWLVAAHQKTIVDSVAVGDAARAARAVQVSSAASDAAVAALEVGQTFGRGFDAITGRAAGISNSTQLRFAHPVVVVIVTAAGCE